MRKDPRFWGPDREDECLCGSRRKARSCHALKGGGWSAEPWRAPLVGARTGYSHPICYAKALADCSSKVSREHYISAGLLKEIGGNPLMQGLPFLEGESKRLSVAALASKMLCERHNHALSPLDAESLRAFAALRRFESNYRDGQVPPSFDSVLVSGPRLEAWLLKTGFGILAAGLARLEGAPATGWRDSSDELLLNVLFGDQLMPQNWGMWVIPPDRPQAAAADIATQVTGVHGEIWSMTAEFGAFACTLALGVPGGRPTFRPGALVLLKDGVETQQTLLIGWPPGVGGDPVITTRVGEMDGWDRDH